jgi:hypothetical protein
VGSMGGLYGVDVATNSKISTSVRNGILVDRPADHLRSKCLPFMGFHFVTREVSQSSVIKQHEASYIIGTRKGSLYSHFVLKMETINISGYPQFRLNRRKSSRQKRNQHSESFGFSWMLEHSVTAYVFPSLLILSTLKMEAIRSSRTSVLTRAIRCHIPEYSILHSHRRGNIKSYIALTG